MSEREDKTEQIAKVRKKGLDDKTAKYGLNPTAVVFFGGVLDFYKINILLRKTFGDVKQQREKDGFKETQPGVYDLCDWEEIRGWTKELAIKAQQ